MSRAEQAIYRLVERAVMGLRRQMIDHLLAAAQQKKDPEHAAVLALAAAELDSLTFTVKLED